MRPQRHPPVTGECIPNGTHLCHQLLPPEGRRVAEHLTFIDRGSRRWTHGTSTPRALDGNQQQGPPRGAQRPDGQSVEPDGKTPQMQNMRVSEYSCSLSYFLVLRSPSNPFFSSLFRQIRRRLPITLRCLCYVGLLLVCR